MVVSGAVRTSSLVTAGVGGMNNNAMIVQRFASRLVVVARESGSLSEDPWAIGGRAVRRVALSFPSGGGGKQRDVLGIQ